MRKVTGIVLLVLALPVFVVGCAKPGTYSFDYIEPEKYSVKNEITVDMPFEAVWDGLVRELAKNFFVINNIEKSSRIINVSYLTEHPEDYIDCGQSIRKTSRGEETREYKYESAGDSTFLLEGGARDYFEYSHEIQRKTDLEGRINIYVAPVTESKSVVSVNTIYVFNNKYTQTDIVEHVNGGVMNRTTQGTKSDTKSFTTTEALIEELDDNGVPYKYTCVSKGVLEGKILGIVEKLGEGK